MLPTYPVRVCHLPGRGMPPGCTMWRRHASRGSVMRWAMFCWETWCECQRPVHPFRATLPKENAPLQQNYAPCPTAITVQKWFEEHDSEFKVLTWPSDSKCHLISFYLIFILFYMIYYIWFISYLITFLDPPFLTLFCDSILTIWLVVKKHVTACCTGYDCVCDQ